jgi:5-methylthioadenosine/S-adenosylhomocysteine deaminase
MRIGRDRFPLPRITSMETTNAKDNFNSLPPRPGLEGVVGALKPGMAAHFSILDLSDPSFVPFNSAARQIVYSETERSVETVVVDGQVVVENRKIITIDYAALQDEVTELMGPLLGDLRNVRARLTEMTPYLEEAARRALAVDIGISRYIHG